MAKLNETKVGKFMEENSPAILTGLTIVGVITTGILAYKAGIKAHDILQEHKEQMQYVKEGDKEAKKEVTKETAKELVPVVLPPVLVGAVTMGCAFGSNYVSTKKAAVLSLAYTATRESLKELEDKNIKLLGDKKAREIKDSIAEDKVKKEGPLNAPGVVITGNGTIPCVDLWSRQKFYTTTDTVNKAIYRLSKQCLDENWISLNDMYTEMGGDCCDMGDKFGFVVEDIRDGLLPITLSAVLSEDNQPCLALSYDPSPVYKSY